MKCPNCNETNHEPGARYCHNCGAALLTTPPKGNPGPPPITIQRPRVETSSGGDALKWIAGIALAIAAILLCVYLFSGSSTKSDAEESSVQKTLVIYPADLSGNYIARKIYGSDDNYATIKVYREGSDYAMNVYSSSITRKFTFSYNPTTGEITSEELGNGNASFKELTKETKITFEGWELIK